MNNSSTKLDELISQLNEMNKKLDKIVDLLSSINNRSSVISNESPKFQQKNPLLTSRALIKTYNVIKTYEKEHKHGILAREVSRLRNLSAPTIYDHLRQLEEANMIFWQRGSEVGLEPRNAKFYSVKEREESLWDQSVTLNLPPKVAIVAGLILRAAEKGISKSELTKQITKQITKQLSTELKTIKDNERQKIRKQAEKQVTTAIEILLQRVLIRKQQHKDDSYFFIYEK